MDQSLRSPAGSSANQDGSAAAGKKPWAVPHLRVLPVASHTLGYKTQVHKTFETYTYKQTS